MFRLLTELLPEPHEGRVTEPQLPYCELHSGYFGSAELVQVQNSEVLPQKPNSEQQTFSGHFC